MNPQTRKFEIKYIRLRNAIERKGISMINQALKAQYKGYLDRIENMPPQLWESQINGISTLPIKLFFESFYPMSAQLGAMTRNHMVQKKDAESDLYLSIYEQYLQRLVSTKDYADRIVSITNTTKERINSVLQQVLTEGELGGFGIEKIRQNLTDAIGKNIRENVRARAKAIAQTEMISASNQASTYAADSTGLEYRKYWSTSHLQGIRQTHIMAEQDSIARGGLRKDQPFINGLMYPGDPNGSAEEVINCRCTVLHEII